MTTTGFFVKGSARVVEPPRIEYKGFKYKYSVKGDIVRLMLVRVNRLESSKSHFDLRFQFNNSVVIKKKQNPASKFLYGPVTRLGLRRKKLSVLFPVVL